MKLQNLDRIFFSCLLFTILIIFITSVSSTTDTTCPQEYTVEASYTTAKERYIVVLNEPQTNEVEDPIKAHYTYLRDCMNRTLIYSDYTKIKYTDTYNNTKVSENQCVVYILELVDIYFAWFSPSYVDEVLSKMEVVKSAEKDQEVHIN